jgi:hypothetical protein
MASSIRENSIHAPPMTAPKPISPATFGAPKMAAPKAVSSAPPKIAPFVQPKRGGFGGIM